MASARMAGFIPWTVQLKVLLSAMGPWPLAGIAVPLQQLGHRWLKCHTIELIPMPSSFALRILHLAAASKIPQDSRFKMWHQQHSAGLLLWLDLEEPQQNSLWLWYCQIIWVPGKGEGGGYDPFPWKFGFTGLQRNHHLATRPCCHGNPKCLRVPSHMHSQGRVLHSFSSECFLAFGTTKGLAGCAQQLKTFFKIAKLLIGLQFSWLQNPKCYQKPIEA